MSLHSWHPFLDNDKVEMSQWRIVMKFLNICTCSLGLIYAEVSVIRNGCTNDEPNVALALSEGISLLESINMLYSYRTPFPLIVDIFVILPRDFVNSSGYNRFQNEWWSNFERSLMLLQHWHFSVYMVYIVFDTTSNININIQFVGVSQFFSVTLIKCSLLAAKINQMAN